MSADIDLSGLKDLHLLPEPSVWPLAIGWWLVLGGLLVILVGIVTFYICWHQRPVVYACRKARRIAQNCSDDLAYLKQISILLKRVAIATDGRQKIAPLSDEHWQEFLEKRVKGCLTKGEAHLIAFAPYEQKLSISFDKALLTQKVLQWIQKSFKNEKSS